MGRFKIGEFESIGLGFRQNLFLREGLSAVKQEGEALDFKDKIRDGSSQIIVSSRFHREDV